MFANPLASCYNADVLARAGFFAGKEILMDRTVTLQVDIPQNHTVCIPLPEDLPVGLAELWVVVRPVPTSPALPAGTAAEMAQSPLFGLWSDRGDIADSLTYARRLRALAERRYDG